MSGKDKRHETRIRSESEPEQGVCPLRDKAHASAFEVGGGRRETK